MTTQITRANLHPNPSFEYVNAGNKVRYNLCQDPNFEYDQLATQPFSWAPRSSGSGHPATLVADATRAHSGVNSMLVASTGSSAFAEGGTFTINTTNGLTYYIQGWVWLAAGCPTVSCGALGIAGSSNVTVSATGSWAQVSVKFVANSTTATIAFVCTPTGSGQQFWVDDVLVEQDTTLNAYFDGDSADSVSVGNNGWIGSPGTSISAQSPMLGVLPSGSALPDTVQTSSQSDTGSNSLQITWKGNSFLPSVYMGRYQSVPGKTYLIRFRQKANPNNSMVAGVIAAQAFPVPPANVVNDVTMDGTWKTWEGLFTAFGTTFDLYLWPVDVVGNNPGANGDVTYVDSFQIEDYSLSNQDSNIYFDGDRGGGMWSGTAGGSTSTKAVYVHDPYVDADADAQLMTPGNTIRFLYEKLDSNNNSDGFLSNFVKIGGQVIHDYTAKIMRTCKFTVLDTTDTTVFNFLTDRIRPWLGVLMPDGTWYDRPLGVFLLSSPIRHSENNLNTRDCDGYDQSQVLQDTVPTDLTLSGGFVITSGTAYTDAIEDLLHRAGIDNYDITPSDLTLPTDRTWRQPTKQVTYTEINNSFVWTPGANILDIINDLCDSIGYDHIWFNGFGRGQVHPYVSPDDDSIDHVYSTEDQSIIRPGVDENLDLFSVPNVIVYAVAQADRPQLVSKFVNSNADSPVSTVNRGRRIIKFDSSRDEADQATLDAAVKQAAIGAANVFQIVTFNTLPMVHSVRDIILFTHAGLGTTSIKYAEQKWTLTLAPGADMSHEMRRVVNLDASLIGDPDAGT